MNPSDMCATPGPMSSQSWRGFGDQLTHSLRVHLGKPRPGRSKAVPQAQNTAQVQGSERLRTGPAGGLWHHLGQPPRTEAWEPLSCPYLPPMRGFQVSGGTGGVACVRPLLGPLPALGGLDFRTPGQPTAQPLPTPTETEGAEVLSLSPQGRTSLTGHTGL